jgi:molybdate transport system substrate-binding protein
VFASADERHMQALVEQSLAREPVVFARNELAIVLAAEAPAVSGLEDLPQLERLVLGAAEVPVGRYANRMLERAAAALGADYKVRFVQRVVSRELSVKQVLAKVVLGEADAGIVYRTDALEAGSAVRTVAIAPAYNVFADYPIALTTRAGSPGVADDFVRFVLSARGQALLSGFGFAPGGGAGAPP